MDRLDELPGDHVGNQAGRSVLAEKANLKLSFPPRVERGHTTGFDAQLLAVTEAKAIARSTPGFADAPARGLAWQSLERTS